MAFDIPGNRYTFEAAGDLSGHQYRFVKMSGAGITSAAAATDAVVGVLQNKPAVAGEASTVMVDGISKVLSAGAISAGVPVYLAADGRATATAAANTALGISQEAASGADKVIAVLLRPLGSLG